MPTTIEQLKAAGVELSPEALEIIEANERTLVERNQQILAERKQDKMKATQAEEAARLAAEENARKSGDLQMLEQSLAKKYKAEIEARDAAIAMRDQKILGGAKAALVAEFAGKFVSPEVGKMALEQLIDVSYDDKGEVVTVFKGLDKQPVGTGAKDFETYLSKTPAFAGVLKGVDSSGGGATGASNRGGAAVKRFDQMDSATLSHLQKTDPSEYARLRDEYYSREA